MPAPSLGRLPSPARHHRPARGDGGLLGLSLAQGPLHGPARAGSGPPSGVWRMTLPPQPESPRDTQPPDHHSGAGLGACRHLAAAVRGHAPPRGAIGHPAVGRRAVWRCARASFDRATWCPTGHHTSRCASRGVGRRQCRTARHSAPVATRWSAAPRPPPDRTRPPLSRPAPPTVRHTPSCL